MYQRLPTNEEQEKQKAQLAEQLRIMQQTYSRLNQLNPIEPIDTNRAFFIIWCPTSKLPPTVRFDTQEAAHKVADRMAHDHNSVFYVLRAVQEVRPVATVTTALY
jgi:hypothetical protein